uniref:Haloacid Dehalogenase superfamily, subfamily IB, phosphoserine phosphatase-like n=1 Tax=Candidatus Kentrum eta TaxID=2126337 RepID=A0A450V7K8_9GAMM|nr:MAG: Haloacid Dehalogenase superfamily, subfamily IB, phosphoserine phosphatase-like [Candidatus Kentron sp. H]VFK00793.1 MAG: Haloacid Dehalogenase superfamily, subfamily IB, phosphoserine phosphatase-like [Candidatus Kentron sp. H]VFK04737.1 MAG: Haloacid Dehalogenase superfamily, subfamily IB, phosphoserine phosphatase-like [Candidatus Kentron sp. H]
MRVIVVTDFDETLIEQNTLMAAYRELSDTPLVFSVIRAFVKGRWLWCGPRTAIKEEMYQRMLRGKHEDELTIAGRRIARHVALNQAAVSRIQPFLDQGHELIVASAALARIVQTILEEKGLVFSRIVATQPEIEDRKLTGLLIDGECFGKIKAQRIKQVRKTFYPGGHMVAFGNWPDDYPLLAEADEAYIVKGNTIETFNKEHTTWQ